MKHGKKPTVHQAIFIEENGFNPNGWLVVKNTTKEMHIIQKSGSGLVVILHK